MAFNSYPLPNAYLLWIWSLISFLYTTEKYLHSTPCPWQVILILVVEFVDHLHFWLLLWITCFYCQTYLSNSFCLPCIFWDFGVLYPNLFCALLSWKKQWSHSCAFTFKSHTSWQCTILGEAILLCVEHHSLIWYCIFLPFLNMTSVWKIHGEWWSNLCAFVFKCKIINNAQILGEQFYMRLNISCLQLVFDPDDVSLRKTNISRLGTLCYHEKCRGFGLFLDDIFINWYLTFIWHLFQVVSSIMCWFGSFDIIWTILFLGTLVCAFLV